VKSADPDGYIILCIVDDDALTVVETQLHVGLAWNRVYFSANQ